MQSNQGMMDWGDTTCGERAQGTQRNDGLRWEEASPQSFDEYGSIVELITEVMLLTNAEGHPRCYNMPSTFN